MSLPHQVIEIQSSETQALARIQFIQYAYLLLSSRLVAVLVASAWEQPRTALTLSQSRILSSSEYLRLRCDSHD
jgi:hypothetical protein